MLHQFREGGFIINPGPGEISTELTAGHALYPGHTWFTYHCIYFILRGQCCCRGGSCVSGGGSFLRSSRRGFLQYTPSFMTNYSHQRASPVAQLIMNPPSNAGDSRDTGSTPESRRSLEVGVATCSSSLTWRIPWTEEPGRLQPWGRKDLDMTEHARVRGIHTNLSSVSNTSLKDFLNETEVVSSSPG